MLRTREGKQLYKVALLAPVKKYNSTFPPTEGGVHWCGAGVERTSLKNPISNMTDSEDESEQGDLRFSYSNILGNCDLETTSQAILLKMMTAFTAGQVVLFCECQQWAVR